MIHNCYQKQPQVEGEKISFGGGWLKTIVLLGDSDVLDGW